MGRVRGRRWGSCVSLQPTRGGRSNLWMMSELVVLKRIEGVYPHLHFFFFKSFFFFFPTKRFFGSYLLLSVSVLFRFVFPFPLSEFFSFFLRTLKIVSGKKRSGEKRG